MNTTTEPDFTTRHASSGSEESAVTPETSAADLHKSEPEPNPVRRFSLIILLILAVLFVWYVAADRVAPWTDQARVNTFVFPITPKVSGKVKKVHVSQDQPVHAGDLLVEIDPAEYKLTVQHAEAALELAGQETGAETAGVTAAESKVAEARAQLRKAKLDASRVERIHKMEPGAVSSDTREEAHTTVELSQAQVANLLSELERAKQRLGKSGGDNARVKQALATLEQARLDLAWTKLYAPTPGGSRISR
jgi:multidrug resistance efflux pump